MEQVNSAANFEDVPASISSAKRKIGYPETFEMQLDFPLTRVLSSYIENIQFGNTGYQINNGNNSLVFGFSDDIATYTILPGTYTGAELANEINNRISENLPGFASPHIFPYEFSYDDISNIFTLSGVNTSLDGVLNRQSLKTSAIAEINGVGEEISTFAPLISFKADEEMLNNSVVNIAFGTRLQDDPENPGFKICTSSYRAFESMTVQSPTNKIGFSESLTPIVITVTTTNNITGFALANEIQTAFNAVSTNFTVTYNTNNFKLLIRNIQSFATGGFLFVFDAEVAAFGYTVKPDILTDSYEADTAIRGTTVTHTLVNGVNNVLTINENNGAGDINVTLAAGTYTLAELATLAQTAMNAALTNIYEVTYSARTTKFKFKVQKKDGIFLPWTLSAATTADTEYGFSALPKTAPIILSDSPQFELFPTLSGTFRFITSESIVLPIGTYTPTEAATILEDGINATGVVNTYSTVYNNNRKIFEVTATGGGHSGATYIFGGVSGAGSLYGFDGLRSGDTSVSPQLPITSSSVSLFYGPLYLYIKSNILTQKKISLQSFDEFYKNVIGKIVLNESEGNVITNNVSNDRVNRLAANATVDTVDIRLEDENGVLYYPNNLNWAFTIVFERF